VTNFGFPQNIPALFRIISLIKQTKHCQFGLAVTIVVNQDLNFPLGCAVGGEEEGLEFGVGYNPSKFLQFLEKMALLYRKSLTLKTLQEIAEFEVECETQQPM